MAAHRRPSAAKLHFDRLDSHATLAEHRIVHAGVTALLVLRALAPEPVSREPDPVVEIRWEAPPECGAGQRLVERIEVLLGRPLGQVGDPDLEVTGRVEAEGDDLRLVLEFRQPVVRVRELQGQTCTELRDAAAVVLAMTIDPLVPLEEPEPEPEPPELVEPAPAPEPEPAPEAAPPEVEPATKPIAPTKPELAVVLRLAGGVQYRALPGIAGGPSLAVAIQHRALRVELVGTWWATRPTYFDEVPEVGATLSLGWVAPRVCGVPSTRRVAFPLCAGVELGGMRGAAFGTASARGRTLPWVAAELGGAVDITLAGPVGLWVGVDGVIPLTRPGFTIAGLGELHRVPAFSFQALLGLEIRFEPGRSTDSTDSRAAGQGGAA